MIKITGYTPEFKRILTGWHSFDCAFADQNEIGFPLGQMTEIYGAAGTGKSTFVQSLAFVLANMTKSNIVVADFEGINIKLVTANAETQCFDGELHRIQDVDAKDEKILDDFLRKIKTKDYSVGIVDAIGSISPVSEQTGDLGDANMGRRAMLMAQFSRKGNHILMNNPEKSIILINHQHQRIGGIGAITPGGETKKYNASIRAQVQKLWEKNKKVVFADGSYVIKGEVIKNRWGLENRMFYLFILAGTGVHAGLTAMYDVLKLKLGTVDRNVVKLGDENFGHISKIIEQAHDGNDKHFEPFFEALKQENTVFSEPEIEEPIEEIEE